MNEDSTTPESRERLFEEAILAYQDAKKSGSVDKDDLQARYAPVAAELAEFIAADESVDAVLKPPVGMRPMEEAPARLSPAATLEKFGKYADFVHISSGGMGAVYHCRDTVLGRPLAMKVMHAHLASKPEFVRDFQEEAQVASQLTHPNIAPVHEVGALPDGRPYFTMKLVEGRTLAQLVREYHAAPTAERFEALLRFFVAVCNAVAYAHQRDVLHRDLKPANVMVGAFDEVQVMDWGLSKVVTREDADGGGAGPPDKPGPEAVRTVEPDLPTEPGLVRGTFAYMPPEQANRVDPLDARGDVFALGALLCEILTGAAPYTNTEKDPHTRRQALWEAARTCATEAAFRRLDASKAPAELVRLTKRCLAREPNDRPATAKAVAEGATAYLAGVQEKLRASEIERARAQAKAAEERKKRRWQLGLAAAVLLFVMGAVAAGFLYRLERERQEKQRALGAAEALQRMTVPLQQAKSAREFGRYKEALEAARRAEALSGDERITDDAKEEIPGLIAELEKAVADDAKDQRLLDRITDLDVPLEGPESFVGKEPPDLDVQIDAAFREAGLNVAASSDAVLLDYFKTRPDPVRAGLTAALDLWAIKCRRSTRNADLSNRLIKIAHAIDPDPVRDELRSIADRLQVGAPTFQVWATVLAPIESILPQSDYNRLLEIAHGNARAMPPRTVQLLAYLLMVVRETDAALSLVRQALQIHPEDPGLHFTAAALLMLKRPPDWVDVIGHLQSVRAVRPLSGATLAAVLTKVGRSEEALTLCEELRRLQPEAVMPVFARGAALLQLKRNAEAEATFREGVQRHPDSAILLMGLGAALFEQNKMVEAEQVCSDAVNAEPELSFAHNNRAMALQGLKRYPEAETELRTAIRLAGTQGIPDLALYHSNLGWALECEKRQEEAIAECRYAISLDEDFAPAHDNLGMVFADMEEWSQAEPLFRKAAALRPDLPKIQSNLALALLKLKKVDEAESICREILSRPPDPQVQAVVYNTLGMIAAARNRYPDAVEAYRTSIRLDPGVAGTHSNLAGVLVALGGRAQGAAAAQLLDEGETSYREAIRLAPDTPSFHHYLGFTLSLKKQYPEAIQEYQKAIDLAPEDAETHAALALVYAKTGQLEAAAGEYRAAIRLNPDDADAHCLLGGVYAKLTKMDEAVDEYRKALSLDPDDFVINESVGMALDRAHRSAEAVAPLRRATELKPDDSAAFFALGNALNNSGQTGDAIAAYQNAERLSPDNDAYPSSLSALLNSVGRFREAEAEAERAVQLAPDNPSYQVSLGAARFMRSRFPAAIDAYRDAIQLNQKYAPAHFFLGNALMAVGDFSGAVAAYKKALELDPMHPVWSLTLAAALRRQGSFDDALETLAELDKELPPNAPERAALQAERDQVQKLRDLDSALTDYIEEKKQPADAAESLLLAELCLTRAHYGPAARFYAAAFRTDPDPMADRRKLNYFRAVRCAVAAAGMEGTPEARHSFHQQARSWLSEALADLEAASTDDASPTNRESVADKLCFWKETPFLQAVREPAALAMLPETERKDWTQFWADVDALLKKLDAPEPKK